MSHILSVLLVVLLRHGSDDENNKCERRQVTLMIPWLGPEDQHFVLPEGRRFEKREDQEAYIREWLRGSGMTSEADDLGITWYDARYHQVRAESERLG